MSTTAPITLTARKVQEGYAICDAATGEVHKTLLTNRKARVQDEIEWLEAQWNRPSSIDPNDPDAILRAFTPNTQGEW